MACVVKTGKCVNGKEQTEVLRGFNDKAVNIQIHKGIGHDNEIFGKGKPGWPTLTPIPVLSIGKEEKIGLGRGWTVRAYWRDEKKAYGVPTHNIIAVGEKIAITTDIYAPDKMSDGGLMSHMLLVAYLQSAEAEEYLGINRDHINEAITEFRDREEI